jgi:hypothetical protein
MELPGQTGLPGAEGRFDDLQAIHQHWTNTTNGDIIHSVVSPLPCHPSTLQSLKLIDQFH